ncbi:hypothetical protein H2136_08060 [Aeromonas hydrophila]|uniref:Uncharacterized protein n=1 Tax=Aeromonas hydrophila TaxID=644 RepID=A0A926IZ01_AERHY|nr:hypothetical protein [Aeromonas hydrophila]
MDGKTLVTLSGTVSRDAKVGDAVILTLSDGSKLTTQVVELSRGHWALAPALPPTSCWAEAV